MSKATETADITVSTGMLIIIGMLSVGGVFASASPADAPSKSVHTVSVSTENSPVMTSSVSGGTLQK